MTIAIQTSKASRIRAVSAANPHLSDVEIARRLGIRIDEVRAVLARKVQRRAKTVANWQRLETQ